MREPIVQQESNGETGKLNGKSGFAGTSFLLAFYFDSHVVWKHVLVYFLNMQYYG